MECMTTEIKIWVRFFNLYLWAYALEYGFIRFAIYDGVYNKTRGLPYNYIGNTDFLDKLWRKMNIQSLTFPKVMALTVGIAIPFNIPKNYGKER